MFIGYFAVAFASKRAAPRTSLGTLLLAAAWCDGLAYNQLNVLFELYQPRS